jgi:RIO kinase 1
VQNTAVVPLPAFNTKNQSTSQQTPSTYKSTSKPSHTEKDKDSQLLSLISKYNSRISNISTPYQLGYGLGGVGANNKKGPSEKANLKDKSDRATNEQVLDPRTRIILFKMIGRGLLFEINGCVSTGKEVRLCWYIYLLYSPLTKPQWKANVYHAVSPTSQHLALKIYKTSILIFKDRDRYVSGEHRFRHGYSRRNPRKMVRLWAEKEMRNLKRLVAEGIRAPEPVEVRENVLVMGFLGDDEGW